MKWNNIEIANQNSLPWFKGKILIPVQVLTNNSLIVERLGLPGTSIKLTVNAESIVPNKLPIARFSSVPEVAIAPELINFNAMLSSDSDGLLVGYDWDFGDGEFGSGSFITHQYLNAGTYPVKLTVTDDRSGRNTLTRNVVIKQNILPIPSFNYVLNNTLDDYTYEFNANDSTDSDGTIVSYEWNFSDLGTSTIKNPTFKFSNLGEYNVILKVAVDCGENTVGLLGKSS